MTKRIAIVHGHPDPDAPYFGHRLAAAYAAGATEAGHEVRHITVAQLDFPLPRSAGAGALPAKLQEARADMGWANHLVLIFPARLGTMPAMLKTFLEHVLRPGFAVDLETSGRGGGWARALRGKSARILVTMGLPGFWHRCFLRAQELKGMRQNLLGLRGARPDRESLVAIVEARNAAARHEWLAKLHTLGRAGI